MRRTTTSFHPTLPEKRRPIWTTVVAGSVLCAALLVLGACATPLAVAPATPAAAPGSGSSPVFLPAQTPPAGASAEFRTDFSRHTVPYGEILSGGPPKDGIPAIDQPQFVSVDEAAGWLQDQEPVILVQVGRDARAYPLQILMWHEIVNDTLGGVPLAVTFCPLCNTAIAFERTLGDRVFDFGASGRLRFSNLIMYDRQTETWWQQASGEAIAGELAGQQLTFYPAAIVSWADFRDAHPTGQVLSRTTGFDRTYGRNPYTGYDDVDRPPFLYEGPPTPGQLPPMARVVTVDLGGEAVAYPYTLLEQAGVIHDRVADQPVVVFWAAGTASALDDDSIARGRDVGTAAVFSPQLDGRALTFYRQDDGIFDRETGSQWDILGRAIAGPLQGQQLTPIVSINHFWFSWAAFRPETRIYTN